MDPRILGYFPRLQTVLSKDYRNELEAEFINVKGGKAILLLYSVFVDITIRKSHFPYSALDMRNNQKNLYSHFALFVGFIYSFNTNMSYSRARIVKKAFIKIFNNGKEFENINLAGTANSDNIKNFISKYKSHRKNKELEGYYSGWICHSKEGKKIYFHAAKILDKFGKDFTNSIHKSVVNFSATLSNKTAVSAINLITIMLNVISEIHNDENEVRHALKPENSTSLMLKVYHILFSRTLYNGQSAKSFITEWAGHYISYFTKCFIEGGQFLEPIIPFICPDYRSPQNSNNTISIGGKVSKEESERFFSEIPLHIKDDETIEIIKNRIEKDINHIRIVCKKIINEIISKQKRNNSFINTGEIKEINKKKHPPMGLENLRNTVSTYYHHGIGNLPSGVPIAKWLNIKESDRNILIKELNIPTIENLLAFAILLIIEHPSITPSWLDKWELYDKRGKQVGLKKVGKEWIAISYKSRRGPDLAEQPVFLNENSKLLVDALIKYTKIARDTAKENGASNWNKVFIYSYLGYVANPESISSSFKNCKKFHKILISDSYDEEGNLILTELESKKLSSLVTLRNVRKSRGLQVYLNTYSIKSVADILGHKEASVTLLKSYLPEPIINYFNMRWVRIFQNAIIFESMKESPYLLDAIDISKENLIEFLHNHKLGKLPSMLEKAKNSINVLENQYEIEKYEELVFTLSTPLFQVLIAIKRIVDSSQKNEVFPSIITQWYESANFILEHFSLKDKAKIYRSPPIESLKMYENAVKNPIDLNILKANLSCHLN